MGWKNRGTFRDKHFVEHQVSGETLRFYPNRIALLQDLAELSKPIGAAIAGLFADRSSDSSQTEKVMVQSDTTIKESTFQAASVEVLQLRAREREQAVAALLDAVSNPKNRLLLGRLLMDSLREEFPYVNGERKPADVEAFLYGGTECEPIDLPELAQLIAGWIKANAKQFGKVGEEIAARVRARLGGDVEVSPNLQSESPSESPTPSSGSSSRTHSSPPSPVASA